MTAPDLLATVYRDHHATMLRYATRMLGCPTDAEDVVHDAYARILACDTEPASWEAWLAVAVRRLACDRLRWRGRRGSGWTARLPRGVEPDHADQVCAAADAATALHGTARDMPEPLRAVIELRYLRDRRNDDVAAALGIDKSTASRRHTAGLAAITAAMTGRGAA